MGQKLLGVIAATGIGIGLFAAMAYWRNWEDKINLEEWGFLAAALVVGSAIGIIIGSAANKLPAPPAPPGA
jgi:hypothetical protein